MMTEFFSRAHQLSQGKSPYVIVTVLSDRGHAPQDPGAKAIITLEGLYWGTVGGGKLEAKTIAHAKWILLQSPLRTVPTILRWNLQADVGMSCGGEVQLLFEPYQPLSWPIAIFGAGHIAQAVVRTLALLPCQMLAFDSRAEWVEKFPELQQLQTYCLENITSGIADLPGNTFFLVMTQGHATDLPVLREILRTRPTSPYVGVLGSPIKAKKIRKELVEEGFASSLVGRVHCPMGLEIGTNHPGEIALSIAAQILQVRDQTGFAQATSEAPVQAKTTPAILSGLS